jgi:quercetin dioxygenase-like cupin family protein
MKTSIVCTVVGAVIKKEFHMQRKLTWVVLSCAVIVVTVLSPGKAWGTPPSGFTSTTVAQGQFDEFEVFNMVKVPTQTPPPNHAIWKSKQSTKGLSDGAVFSNVWQPGGTTGWHTHPGHTLVFVTAGAVTQYQADDPSCTPHVYTAGMSFVDHGGDHIHIVRNEGTVEADAIAIRLVPAGQPGRIDAPAPGNCPF